MWYHLSRWLRRVACEVGLHKWAQWESFTNDRGVTILQERWCKRCKYVQQRDPRQRAVSRQRAVYPYDM